jgi:hypothetical protein
VVTSRKRHPSSARNRQANSLQRAGARVSDPGSVRGARRRWRAAPARWTEAACSARSAALARERGRLDGRPRRQAVGRKSTANRTHVAPERDLGAAPVAGPECVGDASTGLPARGRPGVDRPEAVRTAGHVRAESGSGGACRPAPGCARVMAGRTAARVPIRAVRGGGDLPARGAASRHASGPHRSGSRVRTILGGRSRNTRIASSCGFS